MLPILNEKLYLRIFLFILNNTSVIYMEVTTTNKIEELIWINTLRQPAANKSLLDATFSSQLVVISVINFDHRNIPDYFIVNKSGRRSLVGSVSANGT